MVKEWIFDALFGAWFALLTVLVVAAVTGVIGTTAAVVWCLVLAVLALVGRAVTR